MTPKELFAKIPRTKQNELTELDLSNQQLTELPPEIGQFKNLQNLNLSENQLSFLPQEIGQLKHLQSLDLSQNQIISLPKELNQLKDLKQLNLQQNQLSEVPREILQLTWLAHLDLSKNQLKQLPKKLTRLRKLKEFNLQQNPLSFPPLEVIEEGTEKIMEYMRTQKTISYFLNARTEENDPTLALLQEQIVSIPEYTLLQNDAENHYFSPDLFILIQELDDSEDPQALYKHLDWARQSGTPLAIFYAGEDYSIPRRKINFNQMVEIQQKQEYLLEHCSPIYEYNSEKDFCELVHIALNNQWVKQKTPTIRLKSLTLQNIGAFGFLELDFDEQCSLLSGGNGVGKTTILQALALAILGPQEEVLPEKKKKVGVVAKTKVGAKTLAKAAPVENRKHLAAQSLLRIQGLQEGKGEWASNAKIHLTASINEDLVSNEIVFHLNEETSGKLQVEGERFEELFDEDHLQTLIYAVDSNKNRRPLASMATESVAANSSSERGFLLSSSKDLLPLLYQEGSQIDSHFFQWLVQLDQENREGNVRSGERIQKIFTILSDLVGERIAFKQIISIKKGTKGEEYPELWLEVAQSSQAVPLHLVGKGYQDLFKVMGTLLWRMDQAYEASSNFEQSPAILLLDDLQAFLNPRWQKRLISTLQKHFPQTQWIMNSLFDSEDLQSLTEVPAHQIFQLEWKEGKIQKSL